MYIAVEIWNSAADSTGSLLPENRLLPLRPSLDNSCGSCCVQVHPRIARAATSALWRRWRRRRSRTQWRRCVVADISTSNFAINARTLHSFPRRLVTLGMLFAFTVISPCDILMPAFVNVAKQHDATRCHRVALLRWKKCVPSYDLRISGFLRE